MGMPPDFEIKVRKRHGFVVGYPENADIRQSTKPAADKDRVGKRRVMVSGKNHDRETGFGKHPPGAVEDDRPQLVVLECVAGQQKDVGAQNPGGRQHRVQCRGSVAAMGHSAIFDMQIRAVNEYDIGGHRQAIAPTLGDAQPRDGVLGGCARFSLSSP
jgi:hypothetical protein